MKVFSFVAPLLFKNFGCENKIDIGRGYMYSFRDEPFRDTIQARVSKCGITYCNLDADCPEEHRCNRIGETFSICLRKDLDWNQKFY